MTNGRGWVLRTLVWFIAGSMFTTILHEFAHAATASALGVRGTLFSYWADVRFTEAQATSRLAIVIRLAGPLVCLVLGIASWLALRRARHSLAGLPFLFFSVFGLGTFFGNLMSASFVGDFSSIAMALSWPMPLRYLLTGIGGIALAALHVWAGRELMRLVPPPVGRITAVAGAVLLPVIAGTITIIVVNQPMPAALASARLAEASFWVFAAAGAFSVRTRDPLAAASRELHWSDVVALLLAVAAVRTMTQGLPF